MITISRIPTILLQRSTQEAFSSGIKKNFSNRPIPIKISDRQNVSLSYKKLLVISGATAVLIFGIKRRNGHVFTEDNFICRLFNVSNLGFPIVSARRHTEDNVLKGLKLNHRERRFMKFASVEHQGQLYMTPQDFIESVTDSEPRPRLKRRVLSENDIDRFSSDTPSLSRGSPHMFRTIYEKGIVSYTEYLFLLSILTKPQTGFRIAFNMFDTDGNQRVDKGEFLVLEKIFSTARKDRLNRAMEGVAKSSASSNSVGIMWTCSYCQSNRDELDGSYNRSNLQYHDIDHCSRSFLNSDFGQMPLTATPINETFIVSDDVRSGKPLQSTFKQKELTELLNCDSYFAQNMPPLSPVLPRRNRCQELSGQNSDKSSFHGFDSETIELNYSFSHLFTSSEEDTSQLIPYLSNIDVNVPPLESNEYEEYESLMPDVELPTSVADLGESSNVQYRVVENSTARGGPRLIDSDGYSYTKHKSNSKETTTTWRCSTRNKIVNCGATVTLISENILHNGPKEHCHSAPLLAWESANIVALVNTQALLYPSESAYTIAQNAMLEFYNSDAPAAGILNPKNLAKNANCLRRRNRPKDPHSLEFEIEDLEIPAEFLKADIRINSNRHLIFASNHMIAILSAAKNWYVDATFKITANSGMPFMQLFSIHAFIASPKDNHAKQIPLAFVLMSGRRAEDYSAVLEHIIELTGNDKVLSVTMDFEAALWVAFRRVLPQVMCHGCLFHWNQAIYRHIQQLGLAQAYNNNHAVRNFCRNLMALPFLPPTHIPIVFKEIEAKSMKAAEVFQDLIKYMRNTWFASSHWTPESWSVFKRAIRTNNDCEGWHNRLNHNAKNRNLGFHMVVSLLERESMLISFQTILVGYESLKRCQKEKYKNLNNKIFEMWDSYEMRELSPMQLINYISKINGNEVCKKRN